jgi:hypothetical protein
VAPDVPRLLINRERVGHSRAAKALERRRREEEARRKLRACASGGGGGGSPSPSGASDEANNAAGTVSDDDAARPTAGAGADGIDSGCESDVSGSSDSSSGSGASGGFDFGLPHNARDAMHLGDADVAARQLAALLGWGDELKAAIAADAQARAAAAAAEEEEKD